MIKLTLLIPTLDRSGAEKQLTLLATRLPRDEFDVEVVALTRGGPYESELRDANIPVSVIGKRWKFDPFASRRLKAHLKARRPDILHTWLFAANAYGRLVSRSLPRTRIIVSERCVDSWKSGWQLWLDRRLRYRMDRLVANSPSVAEFYAGLGVPADRITTIPNGVPLPSATTPAERSAVRAGLGVPHDAGVVGFIGRLAPQKRVHDLIWGLQLLRQITDRIVPPNRADPPLEARPELQLDPHRRRQNVWFLVVGDGPERRTLEELARHMGCEHRVKFLGHRDDTGQLLQAMDVFWLGSDFEGMSNSVMEAMSAGLPVVCSDIPANRELVVDGQTGYVVKVGDSAGFAQFTDRILADADLQRRLGEAGRERMRMQFSVESMVEAHAMLYRQVIARDTR